MIAGEGGGFVISDKGSPSPQDICISVQCASCLSDLSDRMRPIFQIRRIGQKGVSVTGIAMFTLYAMMFLNVARNENNVTFFFLGMMIKKTSKTPGPNCTPYFLFGSTYKVG